MSHRVAIITGAARGIGAATAARLARDGAQVALIDLRHETAEAVAREIVATGGNAFAVAADVSDPRSVETAVEVVVAHAGQVDILVNNAGIGGLAAPTVDYPNDEWRRVLAVDLDGVFYCTKAVLRHMLARRSGRIVNVSSTAGLLGNENVAAYSAAKAGVIGFTKATAKELAQSGILVNCVTPAMIETEILGHLSGAALARLLEKVPLGRMGRAEEAAEMIAWICSDACSFTTGAVFDVSGGRVTF